MPHLNTLDLVVADVPAATAWFRDCVGLQVRVAEERFAEIEAGAITIMLTPDAMVPTTPAAGVILHFQVEDVRQALQRAREHGATVLLEPMHTDWGWESAMIAGPAKVIIDLYRPLQETGSNEG